MCLRKSGKDTNKPPASLCCSLWLRCHGLSNHKRGMRRHRDLFIEAGAAGQEAPTPTNSEQLEASFFPNVEKCEDVNFSAQGTLHTSSIERHFSAIETPCCRRSFPASSSTSSRIHVSLCRNMPTRFSWVKITDGLAVCHCQRPSLMSEPKKRERRTG
jgi:hypothetical protein